MKNMISGGRAFLEEKEYIVLESQNRNNCRLLYLKDLAAGGGYYCLKLLAPEPLSDVGRQWSRAADLVYEKMNGNANQFGKLRKDGIYIPQVYTVAKNVCCHDTQERAFARAVLTEYIAGSSLACAIGTFPPESLYSVCRDVARAVYYMNRAHGFCHLDIDRENIVVDNIGRGWLIDYIGAYTIGADGRIEDSGSRHVFSGLVKESIETDGPIDSLHTCEKLQSLMLINIAGKVVDSDDLHALRRAVRCDDCIDPLKEVISFFERLS